MRFSSLVHVCRYSMAVLGSLLLIHCDGSGSMSGGVSTFTLVGSNGVSASLNANAMKFAVSPSTLNVKVYSLAVSTDEFCSDPIIIFSNDTPDEVDLASNPTLGSGEIPNGTYPCVMIEMTDTFSYTPDATEGACIQDELASKGVCDEGPLLLFDGTDGACTTGEDIVTLYLSTVNTIVTPQDYIDAGCDEGTDCNGFMPPTDAIRTRGGALGSALVVDGDQSGTFVVDLSNGLESISEGDTEICSIEDVRFSFE